MRCSCRSRRRRCAPPPAMPEAMSSAVTTSVVTRTCVSAGLGGDRRLQRTQPPPPVASAPVEHRSEAAARPWAPHRQRLAQRAVRQRGEVDRHQQGPPSTKRFRAPRRRRSAARRTRWCRRDARRWWTPEPSRKCSSAPRRWLPTTMAFAPSMPPIIATLASARPRPARAPASRRPLPARWRPTCGTPPRGGFPPRAPGDRAASVPRMPRRACSAGGQTTCATSSRPPGAVSCAA